MSNNKNLHKAKKEKNDEFYTMLSDIEAELQHYEHHFKDKVVYCNCDNPEWSNFWKYFKDNFERLGLKRLIATYYDNDNQVYRTDLISDRKNELNRFPLKGNGDFRSQECIDILKEADIVVTNPPFSLFREYVGQLMEYGKKFLIIGNVNVVTYKEFFPLIKDGFVWPGFSFNKTMVFAMPESYKAKTNERDDMGRKLGKVPSICWFTNLDISKRHESLDLRGVYYDPDKYPKYDNYDAIEVSKTADIPCDYYEAMGVPITFLDKYCPEQFAIIKFRHGDDGKDLCVNGKCPYFRILIQRQI